MIAVICAHRTIYIVRRPPPPHGDEEEEEEEGEEEAFFHRTPLSVRLLTAISRRIACPSARIFASRSRSFCSSFVGATRAAYSSSVTHFTSMSFSEYPALRAFVFRVARREASRDSHAARWAVYSLSFLNASDGSFSTLTPLS